MLAAVKDDASILPSAKSQRPSLMSPKTCMRHDEAT